MNVRIFHFLIFLSAAFLTHSPNAQARYRPLPRSWAPGAGWSGGHWYHGGYGDHFGWWWVVGPSWYYYPAPMYPYPDGQPVYIIQQGPAAVAPAPPPGGVAVEAPKAPPGSQSKTFSYYCASLKGYYPNVNVCPEGWVATPVQGPN